VPPRGHGRTIVVDDHDLLWWVRRAGVRGCPNCDALHIIASAASRRGSVLVVHMPDPTGVDRPLTPRLMAALVRAAVRRGWKPGQGSDRFLLPDAVRDVELKKTGVV
jgi:hypothetical protein